MNEMKIEKKDLERLEEIKKEIMNIADKYSNNEKNIQFVECLDSSITKLSKANFLGLGKEIVYVKNEFKK